MRVFRVKRKADDTLDKYKACLVAKRCKQRYGIDYETHLVMWLRWQQFRLFCPLQCHVDGPFGNLTSRMPSFMVYLRRRCICSSHLDMKTRRTLIMSVNLTKPCTVSNRRPRAWYSRLSQHLLELGFVPSKDDTSLFYFRKGNLVMFVLVYVDDIIVTSSSQEAINALLKNLECDFALKDLGDLHYFLGIEVKRSKGELLLSQGRYTSEVLEWVNMLDCKPFATPLSPSEKLSLHDGQKLGSQDSTR